MRLSAGNCFSSITVNTEHTYKQLYDAQTSDFKRLYPNPNQIADDVDIKDMPVSQKDVGQSTSSAKVYQVKYRHDPVHLRIALIDREDKPLANKAFVIKWTGADLAMVGRPDDTGVTDANGFLDVYPIPPTTNEAQLTITVRTASPPPPPGPVPPPPAFPPPYPPAVNDTPFINTKADEAPMNTAKQDVTWDLRIGHLPSSESLAGIRARLENLGFPCNPGVWAGVSNYQKAYYPDKVTGNPNDIKKELTKYHDKL